MSLLENALNVQMKRKKFAGSLSTEHRELALAWAHGKVTIGQVAGALGVQSGSVYSFLANALREELLKGY